MLCWEKRKNPGILTSVTTNLNIVWGVLEQSHAVLSQIHFPQQTSAPGQLDNCTGGPQKTWQRVWGIQSTSKLPQMPIGWDLWEGWCSIHKDTTQQPTGPKNLPLISFSTDTPGHSLIVLCPHCSVSRRMIHIVLTKVVIILYMSSTCEELVCKVCNIKTVELLVERLRKKVKWDPKNEENAVSFTTQLD